MPLPEVAFLLAAGVGAGLTGSVAGLASLVSYPALLAVGLGPVAANVTNTAALIGSGAGATLGSRPEVAGQGQRLRRLGVAGALGGATGGVLLLLTPTGTFERLVPLLIGAAALVIIIRPQPRPPPADGEPRTRDSRTLAGAVYLIAIYGGYFGAAAGVLILALLLTATGEPLARCNAVKNVILGLSNAVATVLFAVLGPISWTAVVPLTIGCLIGGRLGPIVVRRAPAGPLRIAIGVAGLGLAVKLGIGAYG